MLRFSFAVKYSLQAKIEPHVQVLYLVRVNLFSGSFGLGVVGLLISFVLIDSSQALSITHVTMFWEGSELIFDFIHRHMGHHTCSVFSTPGM